MASVVGVIAPDGAESGPVPAALRAATVKVYAVPLVSPVTVCVVAVEEKATGICATPPIEGVTT